MQVRVLHHDHCFDGAASAAFFSRFLKDTEFPAAEFAYTGLAHKASQLFDDAMFGGDVNAIVDFKYSTDPRLTWWFDHHQSAFLKPEDADHFRQDRSGKKLYDPSYKSCTKFIATVARERFGYNPEDLAELVRWADIVDGAQYRDTEEAVELRDPATKLTLVIENAKGHETVEQVIRAMQTRPLGEIVCQPEIRALYAPLYQRHLESIEIIRQQASCDAGVVYFDLVEQGLEGYNKFIPYYLYPPSVYTVSVSVSSFRSKVSVGSNPWLKEVRHNLASICERYGGGGHARVGAISFETNQVAEARRVAQEIAAELKG